MAAYEWSWDDLDPTVQRAAFDRALRDYDDTGSWERGTEMTRAELKAQGIKGLEGREVLKAKLVDGEMVGRARWTPKGFQEQNAQAWDSANTTSPTVHRVTTNVADALASAENEGPDDSDFVCFVLDFSEAFFHSDTFEDSAALGRDKLLFVRVPPWDKGYMRESVVGLFESGQPVYRRLLREVPGTKEAPQAWYRTIAKWLTVHGRTTRSKVDACLFYLERVDCDESSGCRWGGYGALHVDDMRGRAQRGAVRAMYEALLAAGYRVKLQVVEHGQTFESIGERFVEYPDRIEKDQLQYIDSKLEPVQFDAPDRWKQRSSKLTQSERAGFASTQGQLSWVTQRTKPEFAYEASVAATVKGSEDLCVADCMRLNKVVKTLKTRPESRDAHSVPKLKTAVEIDDHTGHRKGFRVVTLADAGEGERSREDWTRSQGGRIVGLMVDAPLGEAGHMAVVDCSSRRLKRTTHSSFDAETVNAIDALDVSLGVCELVSEWQHGVRPTPSFENSFQWEAGIRPAVPLELHVDANDLVEAVEGLRMKPTFKRRRKLDIADIRELRAEGGLRRLLHVQGKGFHADPLTKPRKVTQQTTLILQTLLRTGVYRPSGL